MSIHIAGTPEEIAPTVLIAGDPLRARYVAHKMLTAVICYSEIRGMLGFTGTYAGRRVSVQGTGIGIPSTAIYVHELIHDYGVKKIIRIGTCGALQPELKLGQLILAESAYTDSNTELVHFKTRGVAPKADEELLHQARQKADLLSIPFIQGQIFSTDTFYSEDKSRWNDWISRGVLAIEMETSILYTLAYESNVKAISILAVSDNIITKKFSPAKEREEISADMMKLALEIA